MTENEAGRIPCNGCKNAVSCVTYGLKPEGVEQVAAIINDKRPLKPEQHLYRQGEDCKHFYIVKSGSLRSYLLSADGMEQTLGFYFPGDMIGLDALSNGKHSCSVIALEETSVCELPKAELLKISHSISGLQDIILQKIGLQIAMDYSRITLLAQRTAIEKTANFLYTVSKRYNAMGYTQATLKLTMARRDIANFLGLTIETLCRQLALLDRMQIINIKQRRIQIANMEALKTMVEST